jgi:hypothetical protein
MRVSKALAPALSAVFGALVGAAVTHFYWRARHADELEEVRSDLHEYYKQQIAKETELATSELHKALEAEKAEKDRAIKKGIAEFTDRMLLSDDVTSDDFRKQIQNLKIYTIRPEEFGQLEGFGKWKYSYFPKEDRYVDTVYGTAVDDKELNSSFGTFNPLEHFGEFEDDTVFIRNEDLRMDIAVYCVDGPSGLDDSSEED